MNKKSLATLIIFILILAVLVGAAVFFARSFKTTAGLKPPIEKVQRNQILVKETSPKVSSIQEELEDLSTQMVADLQSEQRLNLSMIGYLRSYQQMLNEIKEYAQTVEKQIAVIEEISKEEFQEDVKLQASLFSGKKPELVAKHLEEFRASRVGAILAKMKEKEASAVLDIWAKKKDPRVSAFYRETMAAYLNNRRRDMHPELFNSTGSESAIAER